MALGSCPLVAGLKWLNALCLGNLSRCAGRVLGGGRGVACDDFHGSSKIRATERGDCVECPGFKRACGVRGSGGKDSSQVLKGERIENVA